MSPIQNTANINDELEVLLTESKRLHEDRRMWDNNIFRLFSLLLSISAVCLAAVIQVRTRELPLNKSDSFYWEILVIAYPYIIYFFTFIFLVLNGAVAHNSAYLAIIEENINKVLKKTILIWEAQVARSSFYSFKSSYFLGTLLTIIAVLVLTIYCIVSSFTIFKDTIHLTGYLILNGIALMSIIFILIYSVAREKKGIINMLKEHMNVDPYKVNKKKS